MASNQLVALTGNLAKRFAIAGNEIELLDTLKNTVFKSGKDDTPITDAQMTALMIVADQYGLNPFTKEIYAFPDKKNGIVPVVGVDGWARIINDNPQFDGAEFTYSEEMVTPEGALAPAHKWVECTIYRKDRSRPIIVREYLDEVYRAPFKGQYGAVNGPWQTHPKRFHRHKTLIQCARLAFGYGGIYDEDEAQRIVEKDITPKAEADSPVPTKPALPLYAQADFDRNFPAWQKAIESGKMTAEMVIKMASTKGELSGNMIAQINSIQPVLEGEVMEAGQ